MMRIEHTMVLGLSAALLVACGDDTPSGNPDAGGNGGVVELSGEITADTTLTQDKEYYLTALTYVVSPATLTVEAGTVLRGDPGSALVVTRGARLVTSGTESEPVIFTSSSEVGERRSGDWGGVVLLGAAPINVTGGKNPVEGIDPNENRASYGGSDDTHD
jgi:hypothetical protein